MIVENDNQRVSSIVSASPLLRPVLERWDAIALPECWLVAGAVAQTVWNHLFGLEPAHGVSDIDIVYFDPDDLSEASEERHAARLREAFSDLPAWIDVKNEARVHLWEARVHLWYEAKFGYPIRPYASIIDAIATFPTTATAIGIRPGSDKPTLHAPYGVTDLLGSIVRPNKKQITQHIYETKLTRWRALWPKLVIVDWWAAEDSPKAPLER